MKCDDFIEFFFMKEILMQEWRRMEKEEIEFEVWRRKDE